MQPSGRTFNPTAERKRVEAVVETLMAVHGRGESLAEVAHDARNMVSALNLYCDLLDQPGTLGPAFAHYAGELRLVAGASRRLVEKLGDLETCAPLQLSSRCDQHATAGPKTPQPVGLQWPPAPAALSPQARERTGEPLPSQPIASLAAELEATRHLLAALAGPSVTVAVDIEGGAAPVRLPAEDLTRALVNLVKNAVEAMPNGGGLRISLREKVEGAGRRLALTVEDTGPGIRTEALEKIFTPGYTEHPAALPQKGMGAGMAARRGLGLAITRSLVEAAGGRIFAENRPQGGARIVMELPAG